MIICAFDTGVSTGVAEFNTNKRECKLSTLTSNQVNLYIHDITFNPSIVVLERIPKNCEYELMETFRNVQKASELIRAYVVITAPSQWKPVSKARHWKCTLGRTIHERDAFMQLRYYMWSHHCHDIGDI
jgi:hypothetical protein